MARIQTLKKKASELSTLCEVDVCFICFTADGGVFTWPEKEAEVRPVVDRYRQQIVVKKCAPSGSALKKRKVVGGGIGSSPVPIHTNPDDLLKTLDCKLLILNEKIGVLEKRNPNVRVSESGLCEEQVRVCDMEFWNLGEEEGMELGLSLEEIESWVSGFEEAQCNEKRDGLMGTEELTLASKESFCSSIPDHLLSALNEKIGDFQKENESLFCVEPDTILNEEIGGLLEKKADASERGLCEEQDCFLNEKMGDLEENRESVSCEEQTWIESMDLNSDCEIWRWEGAELRSLEEDGNFWGGTHSRRKLLPVVLVAAAASPLQCCQNFDSAVIVSYSSFGLL